MVLDGGRLGEALFGERLAPDEYLRRMCDGAPVPPIGRVVLTATPLAARINHGRWIASCDCGARGLPTPGCVVFLDTPLVWCPRCQNGATGRGWRPVLLPTPELRAQIEAVLLCRPNVEDRNWEPSESLADLIAQNLEHGDPVPDLLVPGPIHGPDWRERVSAFPATMRDILRERLATGRRRLRLLGLGGH